jgi:hypothetical protein
MRGVPLTLFRLVFFAIPAAALLSLSGALWQRSLSYKRLSVKHFAACAAASDYSHQPWKVARLRRQQMRYHMLLYKKYTDAAMHPWRDLQPDPPEPRGSPDGPPVQ